MKTARAFLIRLAGWWGSTGRERQLSDELEAHFQMHVDDNVRAGMSPSEARRAAAVRFGSVDAAKEQVRSRWTVSLLENTRQDVVYGVRGLRRNPGFAVTAIFSLALGVGAAIAIFTVADGLLLRPLPCREPDRLVIVWERNTRRDSARFNVVSPANFRDWRAQNSVFENMAVFGDGRTVMIDGGRVEE